MEGLDLVLAERSAGPYCDAGNRLPKARYPAYSETLRCTIPIGASSCSVTFEAERDMLFTDLSVEVFDGDAELALGSVDISYCNTVYLKSSSTRLWGPCCDRKPFFLMGVRDNKKMVITVTIPAAAIAAHTVEVSLSGFQGNGCCD